MLDNRCDDVTSSTILPQIMHSTWCRVTVKSKRVCERESVDEIEVDWTMEFIGDPRSELENFYYIVVRDRPPSRK